MHGVSILLLQSFANTDRKNVYQFNNPQGVRQRPLVFSFWPPPQYVMKNKI